MAAHPLLQQRRAGPWEAHQEDMTLRAAGCRRRRAVVAAPGLGRYLIQPRDHLAGELQGRRLGAEGPRVDAPEAHVAGSVSGEGLGGQALGVQDVAEVALGEGHLLWG